LGISEEYGQTVCYTYDQGHIGHCRDHGICLAMLRGVEGEREVFGYFFDVGSVDLGTQRKLGDPNGLRQDMEVLLHIWLIGF
jgi:hypothetical protein